MTEKLEARFLGENMLVCADAPLIYFFSKRSQPGIESQSKLYVMCYSAENDETTIKKCDFDVAWALAPAAMNRLILKVRAERDRIAEETSRNI